MDFASKSINHVLKTKHIIRKLTDPSTSNVYCTLSVSAHQQQYNLPRPILDLRASPDTHSEGEHAVTRHAGSHDGAHIQNTNFNIATE